MISFAVTSVLAGSLLFSAAGPVAVELQTLDGNRLAGQITELGPQQLVLQTPTGPVTVEAAKLMSVAFGSQPAADAVPASTPVRVELVDGSLLIAKTFIAAQGQATVEIGSGTSVTVPSKSIRYVRFAAPAAELTRQWEEILALQPAADLLVLRKQGSLDYTETLIRDVTAETVHVELDGDAVPVKRGRVEAIVYFRAVAPALADPRCLVHVQGGSSVAATEVTLSDGKLLAATPGGARIELPLESLSRLDYSVGKVQYLSELAAETTEVTPYVGGPGSLPAYDALLAPQSDKSFDNQPLRLSGKQYAKGLAIHSQTRLAYRLAGKYRQLTALAGIDDTIDSGGNVHLQISGDGRTLWEGTIAKGEEPRQLELDLTGVKRLELVVGYGDDLDIGDHLNLCDAKIMK